MNVNELIEFLQIIKKQGKGEYAIIDDGYLNEILEENIIVDDVNNEIIL